MTQRERMRHSHFPVDLFFGIQCLFAQRSVSERIESHIDGLHFMSCNKRKIKWRYEDEKMFGVLNDEISSHFPISSSIFHSIFCVPLVSFPLSSNSIIPLDFDQVWGNVRVRKCMFRLNNVGTLIIIQQHRKSPRFVLKQIQRQNSRESTGQG